MNHDQSAAGNYTDDPTIESGGIMVIEDSKKAMLSSLLARNISSSELGTSKRKFGVKTTSVLRTTLVVAFVSLVIFAIAFTAFAAMSPETSSPVGASTAPSNSALDNHPGLPEEFVEAVLASVFRHEKDHPAPASNSTHRLSKRAIPSDQNCEEATHWLRRFCDAEVNEQAFVDDCKDPDTGFEYEILDECPENMNCAPHVERNPPGDRDPVDHITICVPRTPPREDNINRDGKKVSQYGYRPVEVNSLGNTQQVLPIGVGAVMTDASVSGFVSDQYKSYVILPNNELNAHLRGATDKLCATSRDSKVRDRRDCVPLYYLNLQVGNVIDYSFGLSLFQKAVLFYSIWGTG
ncbi:hypothetical protein IWX90DRAFT_82650 [Phyllosticta citrichinensis]|uniref:Uncharacterized protein n=1 Tax=Phyllosticta citrichinensis TaxID=1130410 RepID=A0ABR1XG94_9PEZI